MIPKRITIKLFLQEPRSLEPEELIPVFHRWIQNGAVEGLLIDVADYKHIQDGPGMILIGDEVDYSLDMSGGRPGMLLRRKYRAQAGLSLQYQVRESLNLAFNASRTLEADPTLQGRIHFRSSEVEIAFPDRLQAPNTAETLDLTTREIIPVLKEFFASEGLHFHVVSEDPREAFALRVEGTNSPAILTSMKRQETAGDIV